ncbi:MAG TPA: hypothetical protein VLX44_05740 [Xanthobacteraceae bacterium]|nr:hypothetical protein [Xanthobacteraceae bacterium]
MADYYPLIAKAVAGLDKSTGEARRALYVRARNALVTQLRGVSPSLSEQDITRERLALEEAIRKVEAEAARQSRFDPPPERKRIELDSALRPAMPQPMRELPPPEPAPEPDDEMHADQGLSDTAADLRRSPRTPPAERGPPPGDGLKGFRHVVADAENLGDATAQASRSAREAYNAVPSPSPEFDRLEPRMEPEGLRARRMPAREQPLPREPSPREPAPMRDPGPIRGPAAMRDAMPMRDPAPARPAPVMRQPPPREALPPPREPDPRESALRERPAAPRERGSPPRERPNGRDGGGRVQDFDAPPRREAPRANELPARDFGPTDDFDAEPAAPAGHDDDFDAPARLRMMRRRVDEPEVDEEAVPPPMRVRERLFAYLAIVVVLAAVAGVVVWQWQPMVGAVRGLVSRTQTAEPAAQPAPTPNRPKITDRIGSNDQGTPGQQQGAADVAQRVVLYEEDPDDQAGKRFVGTALWRTEQVPSGAGQPPETVVRAEISIPDRKMTMKWSLRRNTDKTLPASHTVEVVFTLPQDFPHQGIQNVPGVLMKEAEQQRGVPLSGSAVKVTDGYFLIGLSAVDTEMQRNIQLLKERPWFDVPIVYMDGRRAILAVEKGTPGERAFREAFAAWKQ